MVKWTKEQEAAIKARNSNLLVTAAAGSGKTAVLVERVIRLVTQDGIDIDKLLIVTFTRSAAAEMKERIRKAVLNELEAAGGNQENLRRQIDLLNKAQISTIHSFCQSVVRNNFHLAGIDPGFKVGEDTEMLLLKAEAAENTLENEYEAGHELFYELLEMFSTGRDDRSLKDLVLNIYAFIMSKPDPFIWLQEKTADFAKGLGEFEKSVWATAIIAQSNIMLDGALDLLQRSAVIAAKPQGPAHYLPVLEIDRNMIIYLQKSLADSLQGFIEDLIGISFTPLSRARSECDVGLREEAKAYRDEAKKIINKLAGNFSGKPLMDLISDLNRLHPVMEYLEQLITKFSENYQNLKNERGVVDFNDLEHLALKALGYDKLAEEYRQRFAYIFVDEYQDSNQIQEAIIGLIKKEDNLFMVGDVKQSIYRFRLADPTLFMKKYHAFSDGDEIDRRIFLRNNFRSTANILQGVNYIFKNIMSRSFGEIDYDDDAALYPGKDDNPGMEAEKVEMIIIDLSDADEIPESEQEDEIAELNRIQLEAHAVAGRIKQLLGEKIYDPGEGKLRGLNYKDIVILLRTNKNWIDVFTEVFAAEGIPAYADVDSGYLDAIEISMFINLLKIIDNFRQDVELISVLRSPIYNFSIDELAQIRLKSSEKNFYQAFIGYDCDKDLQAKIDKFLEQLREWQEMARYLPLEELIWQLMIKTGYLYYVTAMPGGTQRLANIRLLFSRARNFATSSMHGLFSFLRYIEEITSARTDIGTAKTLGENDNVVRLMSIHKSKGLEFPVVITAGLGKQFNLTDTSQNMLLHKDLGLGPRFVDTGLRTYTSTIVRNAIREIIRFENLSEEMRILYVAMTRAQSRLIMFGSVRDIGKAAEKWARPVAPYSLAQAKCGLDWIVSVLMHHGDGEILRKELPENIGSIMTWPDKSQWHIAVINKNSIKLELRKMADEKEHLWQQLKIFKRETASSMKEEIKSRLDWVYPEKGAGRIPIKLSVTQIQKQKEKNLSSAELNLPALIHSPDFTEPRKGISGMEKGTAFHFVLQRLDLKRVGSPAEIKGQIDKMVFKQLLKPEEAEAVEIEKILGFYQSAIGQRVLNSAMVKRETPFNYICKACEVLKSIADESEEEMMVQGIIDLYFMEGEDLVLVDYKTDRITADNRQDKIDFYRVQIELYQRALESILQKKVKESYLFFLDINEAIRVG